MGVKRLMNKVGKGHRRMRMRSASVKRNPPRDAPLSSCADTPGSPPSAARTPTWSPPASSTTISSGRAAFRVVMWDRWRTFWNSCQWSKHLDRPRQSAPSPMHLIFPCSASIVAHAAFKAVAEAGGEDNRGRRERVDRGRTAVETVSGLLISSAHQSSSQRLTAISSCSVFGLLVV